MKKLISTDIHGDVTVRDDERLIIVHDYDTHKRSYYDYDGKSASAPEESYIEEEVYTDDPTQYGDVHNGFYSYTTHEVEVTVDDTFGLFGIKDKDGNVVTDEIFWDTGMFVSGLCPVREVNGKWGCINEKGELVLPYIYDDPPVFNKYGVAYGNNKLIDMQGNEIEGTEHNTFEYVEEDQRYFRIILLTEEQCASIDDHGTAEGITESVFDTKTREFIIKDIPEITLWYDFFDGEPCVMLAAAELLDEYDRVIVNDKGIIEARKNGVTDVFDYYEE